MGNEGDFFADFGAYLDRLDSEPAATNALCDLLNPGAPLDQPGETERAVRQLGGQLGLDDRGIRRALGQGDRLDFNDSALFRQVFAIAEARAGKTLPRELLPGIRLESPKITRELSTAWFANRVYDRYRRCLAR